MDPLLDIEYEDTPRQEYNTLFCLRRKACFWVFGNFLNYFYITWTFRRRFAPAPI